MIDIEELEQIDQQVKDNPALRTFVEQSLGSASAAGAVAPGPGETVTRTGLEIAALWSLGMATLLVLRRMGLIGGSRTAQATDTAEAMKKIAEGVETLTAAGFDRDQAIVVTRSMYANSLASRENKDLLAAFAAGIH
jgi:hypothetical protein